MFRVPTWRMSAYSATMSTWRGLHHLGDHRHAGPLARLGEVAQALDAQALEAVRAGARLERAAADDRRAVGGDVVDRLHQLVAALDRARPGHDRQRPVADDGVERPGSRCLGVELARDELVRLGDRGDPLDPRQLPRGARSAGHAGARSRRRRRSPCAPRPRSRTASAPPPGSAPFTPMTSASVAPVRITTNIWLRSSGDRVSLRTKKQRSMTSAHPARPALPGRQSPGSVMPGR